MGQAAAPRFCNTQINVMTDGKGLVHAEFTQPVWLTLCCLSPKRTTVVIPDVTTIDAPPSTANVVTVTPNARTVGDLKGDLSMAT